MIVDLIYLIEYELVMFQLFVKYISFLSVVCSLSNATSGVLSPIVLIPGLAGSQLEAKLSKETSPHYFCNKHVDWFTIWINVEEFWPYVVDCFAENMMLKYDATNGVFSNASHVEIRVPGFGNTSTIEYLDPDLIIGKYFRDLLTPLTKVGYVRGVNIHGAPYDWRLAPDSLNRLGYFRQLSHLIEETYTKNTNTRVTLICHSLGCPTILYFLNSQVSADWKKQYINHLVTLAGAWAGSILTISSLISGSNFMIPTIDPLSLRGPERTMASNYFLLPSQEVFQQNTTVVKVGGLAYTLSTLDQLFILLNIPNVLPIWNQVKHLNRGYSHPGVPVYCVYGNSIATGNSLIYSESGFPDKAPTLATGPGDGSVNLVSLEVCLKWRNSPVGFQHLVIDGKQGEHVAIINSPQVLNTILNIVQLRSEFD